jgi:hypothetical protein
MGWTKIAHDQYERKACRYSTELTGEESGL